LISDGVIRDLRLRGVVPNYSVKRVQSKPPERTMSIHEYRGIDVVDAVISPLFVASTIAVTAIGTITLFGYGFTEPIYTAAGTDITIGWILGTIALAIAFGTNQIDTNAWNETELAVVGSMLMAHFAVAFVPIVRDPVTSNQVVAVPFVMLMAAGYYLIAYY
jgi:hypothetical protein